MRSSAEKLVTMTQRGLYCAVGDFYIDPARPVDRAIITHAHSDHARRGNKSYLVHQDSLPILRQRLGASINLQSLDYGETLTVGGVKVSLHPAGHILGSAQIRLEYEGWIWVVSGDYKLVNDGVCLPFEPIRCHVFITESTFALPLYTWPKQENVFADMNAWWRKNQIENKTSVILSYALGKAQRILKNLDLSIGPIYAHDTVKTINEIFRTAGHTLPEISTLEYNTTNQDLRRALILATPASLESEWLKQLGPREIGLSSGRSLIQRTKKRHPSYHNFILSDHADWPDLNHAVKLSGADKIYTMCGYSDVFARWLQETGFDAEALEAA